MKDERQNEQVGNIRIKEIKRKNNKKKKTNTSDTPIIIKVFVWFMFLAMFLASFGSLIYYFITSLG